MNEQVPCLTPFISLFSKQAKICSFCSIELAEDYDLLLTSSTDCTVRVWTTEGHFVGEFYFYFLQFSESVKLSIDILT